MRQTLGETQQEISSHADAKLEEQIKLRIKERDEKAHKEDIEKNERKKKVQADLRVFFKNYVRIFLY